MKRSAIILHYIIISLWIAAGIALDQWTKAQAVLYLKAEEQPMVILRPLLQLTYVENRGAAWGMLPGKSLFFLIIGMILLTGIVYIYIRIPFGKRYLPLRIIAVLFVCGAVGNMIDRALQGYVVDFFEFMFIDFPVFNVADIYVTVGALLMLFFGMFIYKEEDYELILKKKC